MDFNMENVSTEILEALREDATNEINKRQENRKRELWGNMCSIYIRWVKEFGDIQTSNGFHVYLDPTTPGEANVIYW